MPDDLRYIVRRFNWKVLGESDALRKAPGEHRVAWFDSEEEARTESERREAAVRERVNPFRCGPAFHYLSTFPEYAFRDWLLDADITPPTGTELNAWVEWWDAGLPDQHRRKVWEGLNRVRFHDVITRRSSQVAYAVVQILWDYQDDFYSPGDEGGRITTAFRTRERADAECARLNAQVKSEWNEYGCGLYVDRWQSESWPFVRQETGAEDAPMFEVIEVDVGAPEGER